MQQSLILVDFAYEAISGQDVNNFILMCLCGSRSCRMRDARCKMRDAGCEMRDARCKSNSNAAMQNKLECEIDGLRCARAGSSVDCLSLSRTKLLKIIFSKPRP